MNSEVPVIVLNWNGWSDTFDCLRSLQSSEANVVWLVDNASDEDRTKEASGILAGLHCIRFDANHGFTGAYNRALKMAHRAGYEFAYLLNNDATVTPGFLSSVVQVAASDPRLASVGSTILYHGTTFVEHDGKWNPHGAKQWQPRGTQGVKHDERQALRCPEFASGAGMLVRLEAMERFGYLDDRFFFCWEDAEWCWRLERRGMPTALCPHSSVFHKGGKSDRKGNATYYRTRNRFLLLESEDPAEKQRAVQQMLYEVAVRAEFARREQDWTSWMALGAGMDDALRGRFGPRAKARLGFRASARLVLWSLLAHAHDKRRSLRKLPPGYDEPLRYP